LNKQGSVIPAWGGHLVDLCSLLRYRPLTPPHSYSKFRQLVAVARRSGAKTFVETGTYLGNTTRRCARHFRKIVTIELSEDLHRQASSYLAQFPHIECVQGDALKELPKVLARDDVQDVLIFLDGHFSEGSTARGDHVEPACLEIEMLEHFRDKIAGVVVDDFRCFGTGEWPAKSSLLAAVERHLGASFDMTVHTDQLLVWRDRRNG
jgi:hypothetical protein